MQGIVEGRSSIFIQYTALRETAASHSGCRVSFAIRPPSSPPVQKKKKKDPILQFKSTQRSISYLPSKEGGRNAI